MAQSITLGTSAIRELDGLFSLNDLHAAAGGESKHEPNRFVRLDQTQALITEISNTPEMAGTTAITSKPKVGTYACRELVIAYAAWISAAFHLKVIRVFLGQASAAPVPATDAHKIDAALAAANAVSAQVQAAVFKAIMAGADNWKHQRWMVSLITDSKHGNPPMVDDIESDAFVMSLPRLAKAIATPNGMLPTNSELANLIAACSNRLAERMGSMEKQRTVEFEKMTAA